MNTLSCNVFDLFLINIIIHNNRTLNFRSKFLITVHRIIQRMTRAMTRAKRKTQETRTNECDLNMVLRPFITMIFGKCVNHRYATGNSRELNYCKTLIGTLWNFL